MLRLWGQANIQLDKLKLSEARQAYSPLESFIAREVVDLSRLLNVVATDLGQISRLIKGEIPGSSELVKLVETLGAKKLPLTWDWKTAPEEPFEAVRLLLTKFSALSRNSVIKDEVNLADYLRPDVFIHALRQETAHKLKVPLDKLMLSTGQSDGVYLKSLFIEGCGYDPKTDSIVAAPEGLVLRTDLPAVKIAWIPDRTEELGSFASYGLPLPLYVDSHRTHLICELRFHCDDPRTRILNSAAAFLDNN